MIRNVFQGMQAWAVEECAGHKGGHVEGRY